MDACELDAVLVRVHEHGLAVGREARGEDREAVRDLYLWVQLLDLRQCAVPAVHGRLVGHRATLDVEIHPDEGVHVDDVLVRPDQEINVLDGLRQLDAVGPSEADDHVAAGAPDLPDLVEEVLRVERDGAAPRRAVVPARDDERHGEKLETRVLCNGHEVRGGEGARVHVGRHGLVAKVAALEERRVLADQREDLVEHEVARQHRGAPKAHDHGGPRPDHTFPLLGRDG